MKSFLILLFILLSCTSYAQYLLFNESLKNKHEKILVSGLSNRVVVTGLAPAGYQMQTLDRDFRLHIDSFNTFMIYPPDREKLVLEVISSGKTMMYDTFIIKKVSDAVLFIGSSYRSEMNPEEIIKAPKLKIGYDPDILKDDYQLLAYEMYHQTDTGWFQVPVYPVENRIFHDTMWIYDPETEAEFFELDERNGNIPVLSRNGNHLSEHHQQYILQLPPGSVLKFEVRATCPDCRLRNFEYLVTIK